MIHEYFATKTSRNKTNMIHYMFQNVEIHNIKGEFYIYSFRYYVMQMYYKKNLISQPEK